MLCLPLLLQCMLKDLMHITMNIPLYTSSTVTIHMRHFRKAKPTLSLKPPMKLLAGVSPIMHNTAPCTVTLSSPNCILYPASCIT